MKNKFLHTCLGIAALLFAGGFFIRSIAPAQAAPTPEMFSAEGTNHIGKYMMLISPETEKFYEVVYIWNTETGESVRYAKKPDAFQKSTLQLPQRPM